ncbi:MAG TPA: N-acetylmuramoyl-L-alanine amidase, partial [Thermoanaerobaculia bacterium]|nr:N-acetylmuramoyl-L-alanine amidase [Thermoanaerobaculia bacterium]
VPREVLRPIFRVEAPPVGRMESPGVAATGPPPTPAPGPGAPAPALEYQQDAEGRYAVYRLRGGEALYSAVVVRLTGRVHAEDVNALAAEIARRSGIVDVTDIPIGFPVKVPLDLLQPEFLPEGDPRRLEWEVEQALAAQYTNEVRARSLEGVTVILDAGHGGSDVGASMAGVWESNYVYDVTLRVKRKLEAATLARVETTTRDGDGYKIVDRDVLPYSRGHRVLTSPPYVIADSVVGVHLRWYLANSLLRAAGSKGGSDKVLFVSIHADSLHPSLRGATVYVPDVAGTAGTYGKSGSVFQARKEFREQPRVSMPLSARQRSEGLSRDLAGKVIDSFRTRSLSVHPFKPVRDRILRGRRSFVPAVLRYNEVPAKILLEICNLANAEDRKLLQTREFREEVAAAVVDGILAYFGEGR